VCLVPGIPWTAEYWGTAQFQSAFDSYVKAASLAKDGQVQKLEFNDERMPDGAPMPKGGIAINIAVYVSVPVLDVMGRLVACVLQDPKGSCVYRATTWTMPKRLVDALHFVFYQVYPLLLILSLAAIHMIYVVPSCPSSRGMSLFRILRHGHFVEHVLLHR